MSRVGWLDDHPAYKQLGLNHATFIRKNLASKHGSHMIHLHDCSASSNPFQLFSDTATFYPLLNACAVDRNSRFGANLITWCHNVPHSSEPFSQKSCDAWGCSGAQEERWEVHGHTIGQLPRQLAIRNIADKMPASEDGGTSRWDSFFKGFLLYVAKFEAGNWVGDSLPDSTSLMHNASGHEDLLIDSVARCQWECWKRLRMEALGLHPSAMWKRIQREVLSGVTRG